MPRKGLRIAQIHDTLRIQGKTVHCPLAPIMVPGITTANALDALDVVGTVFTIPAPKSGYILGARLYDLSDQGSALRLHLFRHVVVPAASDSPWSPSDHEILGKVDEINFEIFYDDINSRVCVVKDTVIPYSLPNIGNAETPAYQFHCVCTTPTGSTPTYTAPGFPYIQLIVASDDPDYVEV